MYEKLKTNIKTILNLDSNPHSIALAFSVGVFITITPFYGIHFWIVMLISVFFRLNYLACITGSLVNIPPVAPFVYTISYVIGRNITRMGVGTNELTIAMGHVVSGNFERVKTAINLDMIMWSFLSLLLGCIILGLVIASISYQILLFFLKKKERQIEQE